MGLRETIEYRRTIKSFIDTEYKDYAFHVVRERAIPSVIDGLKPSQRKGLYVISEEGKTFKKVEALAGGVVARGIYMHGSGSMAGAINLMSAPWCNNVPLFDKKGQFGSRLTGAAGIAAPRYTSAKIHSANFKKFFADPELIEYGTGEDAEPKHFLPVIPWILVNGTQGMAIGHACDFLPYNVKDIAANMKLYVAGKPMKKMAPYFEGFKGKVFTNDLGMFCEGIFEVINTSTIRVTEIPFGITREKYLEKLIKLQDRGIIGNIADRSSKGFDFTIKHKRGIFKNNEEIIRTFGLRTKISENLTCIAEDGKRILIFKDPREIIGYFTDFRMKDVFPKRKQRLLDVNQVRTTYLEDVEKLLKASIEDRSIDIRDVASRQQLIRILASIKITKENRDRIAGIPLYRINREYLREIRNELRVLAKERKAITKKTLNEFFNDDMASL